MSASKTTAELVQSDLRHIWHPFAHHGLWGSPSDPVVVIERAEGNTLIDTDGNRYLDAISSLWCNTLGHRVPAIDDAIRAQLDKVTHSTLLGLSNVPAIELAERLADLCPGDLDRIFYSDAGATSVEIALKICAQHFRIVDGHDSQRTQFLTLDGAYHGDTMGSVSLGYSDWFHRHFRHLVFPVARLPTLDRHAATGDTETFYQTQTADAVKTIEQMGATLAGLVIEPVMQGAAGMIPQPPGYLRAVADAARKVGAMVICDEVATGFWRTGSRFASSLENVVPDILCVAKGLSGGYLPLAATVVRPHVFEPFASGTADGARTFFHGHTFTGNPLACAAAMANLTALETLASAGRIREIEDMFVERLQAIEAHPNVREVRRRGLMIGVELQQANSEPYAKQERVGNRIVHTARAKGVMLRPLGDVVVLMPPFSFSNEDIDQTMRALSASIAALE